MKMKNKKCPKTMSGKHIWADDELKAGHSVKMHPNLSMQDDSNYCIACGIIDDRKKN